VNVTRRHAAVILMLAITAVLTAKSPCRAQGDRGPQEPSVRRYLGLVTWFPMNSDIWDVGYGIRYCAAEKRGYLTGVIGVALPEGSALERGAQRESAKNRTFAGLGAGVTLARWSGGKSFVGAGLTLYWVESGPGGEGWVYVDRFGRVLGPAPGETFFLSPEVTAHFQISRDIGLLVSVNLSSEGQAPKKGIYVGLSFPR